VSQTPAPPPEHLDGAVVELDGAAAGAGLDAELDGLSTDALRRTEDGQAAGADVEVTPLEPDDLAAPHAGVGGEVQGGVEPMGAGGVEEMS
jgi:hypothetical protein